MDAVKLKNSCICGNTRPYAECCGAFGRLSRTTGTDEPVTPHEAFRRDLHDLYMYLFPHRNLYQAYWERLSQEEYPHHLLMADADYGRTVVANFFWDYSVQFSDARPILRAARDVEEKDLRLANDFRQWSLAPLWLWQVIEADAEGARVRQLDGTRVVRVMHAGELPEPGVIFAGRLLTHRGREHVHPAVLPFPAGGGMIEMVRERLRLLCRRLGIKSGSGLRPDVHCDEWRRHGALVLALWREIVYDARVGLPARTMAAPRSFRLPAPVPTSVPGGRAEFARRLRAAGAVALDARRLELRYRALALARFEIADDDWLDVILFDEAYRSFVLHWLADHLDATAAPAPRASAGKADAPHDWIAWAQSAHDELGGETPLEASAHDFGRRRLQALLARLALSDEERLSLRRHLGL